ncbi:MAG: sodium:calcium antiporter, partial [Actinobacteria bacterium]|nr:sodium:calcium antiporter [Actinomycetota bacterium]MBV8598743.1 sodium:calcium antiporter [Actinomycetota bacterium]
MGSLSSPVLILVFVAAAIATWIAGVALSKTTDTLDRRFGLGDALGGIVLLAIAGTLPEIAITVSAVAKGNLSLAAGNLIGGIAVQTMVLVICDAVCSKTQSLTYLVGSLIPVLEGLLVVFVTGLVLMGALLPEHTKIGPLSPASLAIVVVWTCGVYSINLARKAPKWKVEAPGSRPGRRSHRAASTTTDKPSFMTRTTATAAIYFGAACVVTLLAGVFLEVSGNDLANRAGINGVIFGATVLSVASALPEISSGIQAVVQGDNELAVADIFGGNSIQVTLFLVADLIAGKPVLPSSGHANSWLA